MIDTKQIIVVREQALAEMAAAEPRTAGDQNALTYRGSHFSADLSE